MSARISDLKVGIRELYFFFYFCLHIGRHYLLQLSLGECNTMYVCLLAGVSRVPKMTEESSTNNRSTWLNLCNNIKVAIDSKVPKLTEGSSTNNRSLGYICAKPSK